MACPALVIFLSSHGGKKAGIHLSHVQSKTGLDRQNLFFYSSFSCPSDLFFTSTFLFYLFFFAIPHWHLGSQFTSWGSNLCLLQQKHGVLTAEPSGKPLLLLLFVTMASLSLSERQTTQSGEDSRERRKWMEINKKYKQNISQNASQRLKIGSMN